MPRIQNQYPPFTINPVVSLIRGRLFICESNAGHNQPISCRIMAHHCYACVNRVFQSRPYQSTIHSAFIWVHFAGQVHKFAVFCVNHQGLPLNHSIPGGHNWRGDILVMRCGISRENTFVNVRCGDDYIIDQMLRRFVLRANQVAPFTFPAHLIFRFQ